MRSFLVTGATGSLGRFLVEHLIRENLADRIVVYSRDEVKQAAMQDRPLGRDPRLRYFLGDVRDRERLLRAMHGIDTVVHTAALARVSEGCYNPDEILKTNVLGTENVIEAAAQRGAQRVLVVCSDKGCHASNHYGGSKFMAEQFAVASNAYTFPSGTAVSCVRFGNLMWSRDSVAERFQQQLVLGKLPFRVTDSRMSRFGLPLPDAVSFILSSLDIMRGGEIFVPALKSFRIVDLAEAIYTRHRRSHEKVPIEITGLRAGGEKLHEMILTPEEMDHTVWVEDLQRWVIEPHVMSWSREPWKGSEMLMPYLTSESNPNWFTQAELIETLQWIPR